MMSHLEKNFNYDMGNDVLVSEAEGHLRKAAENLRHAIEAARHEGHEHQAGALDAVIHELEAKIDLLGQMRQLKD
jgi:hypothetical protein